MRKQFYSAMILICVIGLSACTLPNLYDVDLPSQAQEDTMEQPPDNINTSEISEYVERLTESNTTPVKPVFTFEDVDIKAGKNNIYCINNYTSEDKITFAWYIVNKETQQPIYKEPYNESNEFCYEAADEGIYQIVAYIRQGDDRTSIIAGEYSFDSESGVVILSSEPVSSLKDFSESDISVEIDENNVILTNHYDGGDITFAWYLIDTDKNEAVLKESYTAERSYKISLTSPGNYRVDAFVRNSNNERNTIIAVTFSFDGKNITLK